MARRKKADLVEFEALSIKEKVIEDMKGLGTYKPEYEAIISIYSDLLAQYHDANEKFKESDYQYETETAAGGTKKSAIVATLENLRKDIIAYSDRLCLNPKSVESVTTDTGKKKKKSALGEALSSLGD
ncbi:P27 family phage terminase small subunit [Bacillus sp. C30]|uniref:P27 family phage terminase small subunit n=1 Tax=Bacillus sp. C30 TaxID=1387733 RepID=UPI00349F984D